jgi:hypothetical protein
MKKSIFILLYLCLYSVNYANTFTIRFGKGTECTGFNICGISMDSVKEYNEAVVDVTVTKNKHIQFAIQRRDLTDRVYFKFFSTGVFVMDGDYNLPQEICNQLHIDSYTIHSGRYEIATDNTQYLIVF